MRQAIVLYFTQFNAQSFRHFQHLVLLKYTILHYQSIINNNNLISSEHIYNLMQSNQESIIVYLYI